MKEENISILVKSRILRIKERDKDKIKSLLQNIKTNMGVVKKIPLDENSATIIFRETYESLRQLGDAQWWSLGYEPANHEISLDLLKETEIKDKTKLNYLDRFKQIRHDANYHGFKASVFQAKEILEFWDICGIEILKKIETDLD